MTQEFLARVPVAFLRKTRPEQLPLWRKILLPLPYILQRIYGGVWVSGDLVLTPEVLHFAPTKGAAMFRREPLNWTLRLDDISDVGVKKGAMMETIAVSFSQGSVTLKSVRTAQFLEQLEAARAAAVAALD